MADTKNLSRNARTLFWISIQIQLAKDLRQLLLGWSHRGEPKVVHMQRVCNPVAVFGQHVQVMNSLPQAGHGGQWAHVRPSVTFGHD
eukprot:SAG31_NODE_13032_length_898_cov_0.982478_3_plen_86_part_01